MRRVAFVDMSTYRLSGNRWRRSEPVHLLGMHRKVVEAGHQTAFFWGSPATPEVLAEIHAFCPEIVLLSFIENSDDGIHAAQNIIQHLQGRDPLAGTYPMLFLGGPDVKPGQIHVFWKSTPHPIK